ncbi:MAG: AtpZ/AtpI family protein [Planctomycetaceae bacterium]
MSAPPDDRRPPVAVAMEWVSRITTVALTMVLPAWAGYWCDGRFGTGPWLLILGAGGGMAIGMLQLLSFVDKSNKKKRSRNSSRDAG